MLIRIGVAFKMYAYDKKYKEFETKFKETYPEVTGYEIINFYKIHVLNELAKVMMKFYT